MALELETAPLSEVARSHSSNGNGSSAGFDLDDLLGGGDADELNAADVPFDTNEPASPPGAASEGKGGGSGEANDGLPGEVIASPTLADPPAAADAAPAATAPAPDKPKKGRKKKVEAVEAAATTATDGTNVINLKSAPDRSPEIESLLDEINRERMHATAAKAVVIGIKSDLKDARKSHEAACERVMELLGQLDSIRNDQNRPLIKKAEAKSEAKAAEQTGEEVKPQPEPSGQKVTGEAAAPAVAGSAPHPQSTTDAPATPLADAPPDPAPAGIPINAKPLRVRLVRIVSLPGDDTASPPVADLILNPGREFDCRIDDKGDVLIAAEDEGNVAADVELEPEDFEVIQWEGQADPNAPVARDPNGWRNVALADLLVPPIPPGVLKSIEAGVAVNGKPVTTVGQLADWSEETKAEYTAIKGIGEGKAVKLAEAIAAFHKRWAEGKEC
jgi:hypothetical protein